MRQKRFPRRRRGTKKRGRGIPYIYKNRINLGKGLQTGSGAVCHVITRLLENMGDIIGL